MCWSWSYHAIKQNNKRYGNAGSLNVHIAWFCCCHYIHLLKRTSAVAIAHILLCFRCSPTTIATYAIWRLFLLMSCRCSQNGLHFCFSYILYKNDMRKVSMTAIIKTEIDMLLLVLRKRRSHRVSPLSLLDRCVCVSAAKNWYLVHNHIILQSHYWNHNW